MFVIGRELKRGREREREVPVWEFLRPGEPPKMKCCPLRLLISVLDAANGSAQPNKKWP